MKTKTILAAALVLSSASAWAQEKTPGFNNKIPPEIMTPDTVETRIGTLEFKDGAPSKATLEKVYDNLDFTHAYRVFMDAMSGPNIHAIRTGLLNAGIKDNEVAVWSGLMDAKTLMLTANADTVYVMAILDLTKGPWCWRCHRRFSAPSTTIGPAGSPTPACLVPTGAKAGNT